MDFSFNHESEAIFKNVFAFFGTLSSEGYVLSLDGEVFEKTTTDPQLLIGQKFSETVYWQASEHTSETLESAVTEAARGNSQKVQLDFRVSAGKIIIIELYLHPANESKTIFFCAQEFTVREKEIEYYKERSERLLFAAENADIGLWFWDLPEDKIYSTPKCNELFEVAPHQILTFQTFLNIIHPEDLERVKAALEESQIHGKDYDAEYRVIYADGNINWIAARGRSYLDAEGNPRDMMGIVRRVTDKKLASAELAKVYDREKKARNEAEEANRAKDFFLAVVSHELRSPLNAILGWAKILLSKKVDDETRQNALETIEKSARAQAKLIDDLVDSSRVASGKLRLELRPVNLYEVIENVYLAQLPTAEARKISLILTADKNRIEVFGDPVRLQQIFSNLISNALKFTPDGGTVEIGAKTDAKSVVVVVRDNGQGIDMERFGDKIFGLHKTFHHHQEARGVGLFLIKTQIESMGGKISVESAMDKGTTFIIRFGN